MLLSCSADWLLPPHTHTHVHTYTYRFHRYPEQHEWQYATSASCAERQLLLDHQAESGYSAGPHQYGLPKAQSVSRQWVGREEGGRSEVCEPMNFQCVLLQ